ncbi:hypothetical protein AA23498_0913 [Acetobacter nitrogenifigens DSM 23921 = NBRC 105050]|uniref:Protein hcp1 n=1 Tax=Acetobacter nitrogenifigens DSM 23921 = NBRC 105050 TaxID=1120919 RepID=A0A511XBP7_9PROT|nr:type VI secretion system tube protein Hcp [Acetobacter nitrogenifigens]GBQ90562.1 hypothetical protein AA23498_0913 [Acetobacter nitrogenifigens DSM 23921 = NBRC 105050]GEN60315.1 hypothetical protein ANI02nite_21990 [Acetobacter nitrogenifigens DSM 23921 = NBRC 105050]
MAIYMKFPSATGNVTEQAHTDWIEVLDSQWSTSRSIRSAVGVGSNRESSSAYVSELTVTKYIDNASHPLTVAAFKGMPAAEVQIDFTRTDHSGETIFRTITLEEVIISSLVNSGHNQDRPTETLSFNFSKISVMDAPELKDGSTSSQTVIFDLTTSNVA